MSFAGIDGIHDGPQPDRRRQRHLDDHAIDRRVVVQLADRGRHGRLGGLAFELDEARVDPDLGAAAQDPFEIDHRRGVPTDDHDAQSRRTALGAGEGGDILGHRIADLSGDRSAFQQSRGHPGAGGSSGSRGWPSATAWRAAAASRSTSSSKPVTRVHRRVLPIGISHGRQVDDDIGGSAASGGFAEERRDGEVARRIDVAAAGERFGGADEVHAGLDAGQRDLRRAPGRGLQCRLASRLLVFGVARQLERRRESRIGRGVLIGQDQEPVRQRGGPRLGPRQAGRRAARTWVVPRRGRRPSRRGRRPGSRRSQRRCHHPGRVRPT